MRAPRRLTALLIAAALLGACGDDDEPVSAGSTAGDDDRQTIEGEYVATEVTEGGQPKEVVEGTTIRLRLDGGSLSASAGCNTIGGDYTLDGDVLRVGATAMTEMGCDAPRHAQDEWLAGLLSSEPAVERIEEGFVLRSGDVTITFVDHEIAEPDLPLVGTTWIVDGYLDGSGPDGAASSAVGDEARLVLEDNGFVTGHDGCNGFGYAGQMDAPPTEGLRYTVDGDRLTFEGSAVTTDMACPDVDTDRFWAVVTGTVAWEVDATHLTLIADDGRGVTFRAEPAP